MYCTVAQEANKAHQLVSPPFIRSPRTNASSKFDARGVLCIDADIEARHCDNRIDRSVLFANRSNSIVSAAFFSVVHARRGHQRARCGTFETSKNADPSKLDAQHIDAGARECARGGRTIVGGVACGAPGLADDATHRVGGR